MHSHESITQSEGESGTPREVVVMTAVVVEDMTPGEEIDMTPGEGEDTTLADGRGDVIPVEERCRGRICQSFQ